MVIPNKTKDVDVAVSKATRNYLPDECPKEKHVLALKGALETGVQRQYVAISLLNRLHGARDWVTAVKTSVVIHRLIKETQPPSLCMDELCSASGAIRSTSATSGRRRVYPLHMDGFLDTKAVEGKYDFSEWVRAYCKFIDESLDTYWHTGWYSDLEKSGNESSVCMRSMSIKELLETLPRVQRVQRRLIDCRPTGAACQNDNTLLALSLVVRDSFKLYKAISEGIINLADKFFRMDYYQGVKALEIYNEACNGCKDLQKYLGQLGQLEAVKRVIEFPKMEVPPRDFLDVMRDRLEELKSSVAPGNEPSRKEPLRRRGGFGESEALSSSLSGRMGSGIMIRTTSVDEMEKKEDVGEQEEVAIEEPSLLLELGDIDEVAPPAEDVDPFKGVSDLDLLAGLDFGFAGLSRKASLDTSREIAPDASQTNNNPFA